ncbi:trifunctional serine/threonine-protein kinase/ATP-binding protein/sensor histidine kinase [Burkholderia gladioli]|uniref:trifunctional serine/threonine-protein kinase/ATP-binding protein/sensor histidine kinase n=1 Tax=Burkholderia gladioli TaxID=28095 RepID=UPI001C23B163|nr:trifunctional serine/threonine-protein kinase/ATP-binding protein/sensor histidine kinase [Burkholderia gladioli]MBU9167203.1 AAA family ATPase [Burkholderia gladioli]
MIDLFRRSFIELSVGLPRMERAQAPGEPPLLVAGRGSATPAAVAALQREFALRDVLDEAWSAVPQALMPYGDGVLLVLADRGGEPLPRGGMGGEALPAFFALARGMVAAVGEMHGAGLIHRALGPKRFLADREGRVYLTGFGFAVRGGATQAGQGQRGNPPGAGRWADDELEWDDESFVYMAPELGARMNVRVDARADLYSLGCVLYELLSGVPPFEAGDTATRIHAHATRRPRPLPEVAAGIPRQLSRIVLKLLEKAPEQRYANAAGLLDDLCRCEELYRRDGRIDPFALDTRAAMRSLRHSEVVVGREREIHALLSLHRTVAESGRARVAWISGQSGIGKSTLLHEAVSRIQREGAPLLARGKSEEGRRGTPYAILIQALEPLLQYVLACPDETFASWRQRVREATTPVGRTLSDFLPTLATVLGPQPEPVAPPDAQPALERERVLQGMARLLACFAAPDRPLVLLLDDLQWTDVGSLQVLERVLLQHADAAITVIGAFRGNEIDDAHALQALLRSQRIASLPIALGPLDAAALHDLVASALSGDAAALEPLVAEIDRKSGRNPFFARHLLRVLADDGLLDYDHDAATWRWNLDHIARHRGIDDMFELLVHKLEQLPPAAQRLSRLLACLGDRASIERLSIAAGLTPFEVVRDLQPALEAGTILSDGDDYAFGHDSMRESAYASIPEGERAALHLLVARRLLGHPGAQADVFAMAAQVNLAREAVDARRERAAFAALNLDAGRRAKAATAHHSALVYFRAALDFIGEDDGEQMGLDARVLCGEAEFMTGALEAAEARLAALEAVAGDGIFGADLARLRAALYTTLGRYDLAMGTGLAFLRRAGIEIPMQPEVAEVDREYARLRGWLDEHGMEGLRALPVAADPLRRALMDILADLIPPAMYTDQNLVDLMVMRTATLSIAYGQSDASANAYTCMNLVFGARYGDYSYTLDFGRLALYLVDELGLKRYQARVYMVFGCFVVPWTLPARSARDYARRAYTVALESGDHTFANYCSPNEATGMIFGGEYLDDIRETVRRGLVLARDSNFLLVINQLLAQSNLLARLQDDPAERREPPPPVPVEGAPVTLVDVAYWVYRLQLGVMFGDAGDALEARRRAEACVWFGRSFAESGDLAYYGALALIARRNRDADQDAALQRHIDQLALWANACPANFVARRDLVHAEWLRTRDRAAEAGAAYAAAVAHARRHGFTQVEALAAELAGRFYSARGEEVPAAAYLRHARGAWQRWGAMAKVRQLQADHPAVFESDARASAASRLFELDVQAVLRISNALASDIVPSRLVETVLRTALENSGAGYCVLALLRAEGWRVPAQAYVQDGEITVTQQGAGFSAEVLPVSLVQAVARKQDGLLIDDMRDAPAFEEDEYVRRYRPRSVLCVPLMRHATLVGVLYLENKLAAKVFTAAKAAVLEVIASQAAFALENARLYEELVEQYGQRARAEEQLRNALAELERASRLKAMGELVASIVHEVGQPIAAVDTSASAALRWLNREPPDIDETREMLRYISLSATRAKTIIQALRAKARKAEPQFTAVDLGEALREAATLVAGQLDALEVALELRGLEAGVQVQGDRIQLQQVVINLLTNGAEAMAGQAAGDRRLVLSCDEEPGGWARVSVDDHGCGIDPGIAGRLLEPLFTTKDNGMGMGLAISHSIVEAHGGSLTLTRRAEAGTRASFALPLLAP